MSKGYSLHIGLNSVDPKHYQGWGGPLLACEADAEDMKRIADLKGFTSRQLLTAAATRGAVRAELAQAAATLQPGDIFFLSYSGHGGQVQDINDDEADRLDETWCLYDGQLVDDELYASWAKFAPGVRVLVLSDSCHSGTVTKAAFTSMLEATGARLALQPPSAAPAGVRAMPLDVAHRVYRAHRGFYDELQAVSSKEKAAAELRASILLLSGCQDSQLSSDGLANGLFTGQLLRVWNENKFQGGYRAFHKQIVGRMPPIQVPNYHFVGAHHAAFEGQQPFSI